MEPAGLGPRQDHAREEAEADRSTACTEGDADIHVGKASHFLEPTGSRREGEAGKKVSLAFDAYSRPILEERRASPRDDIVSALVGAQERGALLSEREILNLLRLLLAAGSETTTNLIGNGILALLRHPGQLRRLREVPSLVPGAVEELLRFDAPVQTDIRRVLTDCEVNGFPLRKGDTVVPLLGAANRDPEVFDHPDRLDVERRPVPHLSFGSGIHHCLGAPLARAAGQDRSRDAACPVPVDEPARGPPPVSQEHHIPKPGVPPPALRPLLRQGRVNPPKPGPSLPQRSIRKSGRCHE